MSNQNQTQRVMSEHSRLFADMLAKSRQRLAEWQAWAELRQIPSIAPCERHSLPLALDVEESVRASFRDGRMQAARQPCAQCAAEKKWQAQTDRLRLAGVDDDNIVNATFENFICRTDDDRQNLAKAREFAERGHGFLVLMGGVGNGKSHLAVAIMRKMNVRSWFRTQTRMLTNLRASYRNDKAEDVILKCSSVQLFVLDELGVSAGGRDEMPMIHEILTTRHGCHAQATVITTNLSTDAELTEALGARVYDRLRQSGYAKLRFRGESMRPQMRIK